MAHNYWEGSAIASRYVKYRPVPPTELFDRIISFLKDEYTGPLSLAYDVGCGSGQSTQFLAPHFTNVVGIDLSLAQVEKAIEHNKHANVEFKVSSAETIPERDKAVQLISASESAHWFDLPKFYEEGKRVLCHGGVLCLYGYDLPRFMWLKDRSKDKLLDQALQDVYHNGLRDYWAGECKIVEDHYADIVIPYSSFTREETFYSDVNTSVDDIVMLITTWSGFNKFCAHKGAEEGNKLLSEFRNTLMDIFDESTNPEERCIIKRTNFFLLMGRNL